MDLYNYPVTYYLDFILIVLVCIYNKDDFNKIVLEAFGIYIVLCIAIFLSSITFPTIEKMIIDSIFGDIKLVIEIEEYIGLALKNLNYYYEQNYFSVCLIILSIDRILINNGNTSIMSIIEKRMDE
jgi:hypothetical protein